MTAWQRSSQSPCSPADEGEDPPAGWRECAGGAMGGGRVELCLEKNPHKQRLTQPELAVCQTKAQWANVSGSRERLRGAAIRSTWCSRRGRPQVQFPATIAGGSQPSITPVLTVSKASIITRAVHTYKQVCV